MREYAPYAHFKNFKIVYTGKKLEGMRQKRRKGPCQYRILYDKN